MHLSAPQYATFFDGYWLVRKHYKEWPVHEKVFFSLSHNSDFVLTSIATQGASPSGFPCMVWGSGGASDLQSVSGADSGPSPAVLPPWGHQGPQPRVASAAAAARVEPLSPVCSPVKPKLTRAKQKQLLLQRYTNTHLQILCLFITSRNVSLCRKFNLSTKWFITSSKLGTVGFIF